MSTVNQFDVYMILWY